MTNEELFKNDVAFNANNILFTMTDDDVMGHRKQGSYIKDIIDNGHECLNFIFDNGHHYVYDREDGMLYVCEPIPEEFFIHKYLEKVVSDFAEQWSIYESDSGSFIYCTDVEIDAKSLIRLLLYRDDRIVYLTNILIPLELRHKGIGKRLINQVFDICQRLNYRLILLDVVGSFKNSLLKRNAKLLDFDKIEITDDTILT